MPGYRPRVARRSRRSRYSPPRRQTEWVRSQHVLGGAGAVGADLLHPDSIDRGSVVGSTVVRVRGNLQVTSGSVGVAFGGFYFGVYIAQNFQLLDNVNVFAERNLHDWMYWRYVPMAAIDLGHIANEAAAGVFDHQWSFDFDVKSSRRIIGSQATASVAVSTSNWANVTGVAVTTSTLIKLS